MVRSAEHGFSARAGVEMPALGVARRSFRKSGAAMTVDLQRPAAGLV
jgi:hypothetical protein